MMRGPTGSEPETGKVALADIRTFWASLVLGIAGFALTVCPFVFFEIPKGLLIIPIIYLVGFGALVTYLFCVAGELEAAT